MTAQLHYRMAVLRAARGVSRQELADAVSGNPQTIGFIERGDYTPSLDLGLRMADFFAVPVEVLFSLHPFEPLETALRRAGPDNKSTSPSAP